MAEVIEELLGHRYRLNSVRVMEFLSYVEDVLENLDEPFIYQVSRSHNNLEDVVNLDLTRGKHEVGLVGFYKLLRDVSGYEGLMLPMEFIADEDEDWTDGEVDFPHVPHFRKFRLKPHIQEKVRECLLELKAQLEDIREKLLEENERMRRHRLGTIHRRVDPTDPANDEPLVGLLDVDVIHVETGDSSRFVVKTLLGTINEVSVVRESVPADLNIPKSSEEQEASDWLATHLRTNEAFKELF